MSKPNLFQMQQREPRLSRCGLSQSNLSAQVAKGSSDDSWGFSEGYHYEALIVEDDIEERTVDV